MGRLTSVAPPAGDTVAWNATTVHFYQSGERALDLPAGHWRQDIRSGKGHTVNYYDAMWRPVYTERWDDSSAAGTMRITRRRFDFADRATFESYPRSSFAGLGAGTHYEFDALGRPTVTTVESELGNLYSGNSYGNGFTRTYTDARQNRTVYRYQVFDEPVETAIAAIEAPEGVSVAFARDVFGKATSITRSGGGKSATRSYVYDANERLCKTIEPETGATVQAYDNANNIAWRASGLALPSTTGCDAGSVSAVRKTSFGYDARNRLINTSYGDGSPGISRSYTADGLPHTISSNGAVWTNSYNKRRLNERESLAYGGVIYNIDRKYDANGNLLQLTYPDGTAIAYNPNELGEARQVGGYARAIAYHPNGAIASFSYGNGIAHSLVQNARGLPSHTSDGAAINDVYAFDENGNVAGIADQLPGNAGSRSMAYDGLDRLRTASAPRIWGEASYAYDALDNITATTISSGGTRRNLIHSIDAATNRLASTSGTPGYNFAYGYDEQGNITRRGGQTYEFDQANRLKRAAGRATYAYDGLGHRVSVVASDGVNQIQVYSQEGKLLYVVPGKGAPTKYVYLHNHVLAEVTGSNVVYDHTDGLGSPVAQTDARGAILNRTRYEPYGYVAAGMPRKIGFTGHVNDSETGLVYMQQRYYDPIAGRMLSIDPVTTNANTGGSFNRYAYANNSPYTNIDPDGRDCVTANGRATCTPTMNGKAIAGLPSFSVPVGAHFPSMNAQSSFHHEYIYKADIGSKAADSVRASIANDPTGNHANKPASPTGTPNSATPSDGPRGVAGSLVNNDVKSYTFNDKSGATWTVNVTEASHTLSPGYVLRGVVGNTAVSYGEGTAIKQSMGVVSDKAINDVWIGQNKRNIDNAK